MHLSYKIATFMMTKRLESQKLKACLLSKIKQKKSVLFGSFSNKLSKNDKVMAWKEIEKYAKSIGAIPPNRGWSYLRDVWWPNVRKSSMNKIENARTTGSAEGKDKVFNEVDQKVLEIIGKESPVVVGLDFLESMDLVSVEIQSDSDEGSKHIDASVSVENDSHSKKRSLESPSASISAVQNQSNSDAIPDKEKYLQTELLKLQIYKTKLECRILEVQLGISKSSYTEELGKSNVLEDNFCEENLLG